MKPIIIDSKHSDAIAEAIKTAEGRATARTITCQDIMDACENILLRYYGLGASLADLDGMTVSINVNAQDFPKAYKYTPECTWFDAMFHGGKWRLTNVYRFTCGRTNGVVRLPQDAKTSIMNLLSNAGAAITGKRDCSGHLYRA